MNKYLSIWAAAAALFLGACQQEQAPENDIPDGYKVLSLKAEVAADDADADTDTRTAYANEKTFSWSAGDRISVLCNDGTQNFWQTFTVDTPAPSSTFTAMVPGSTVIGALDGTKVALYPASGSHVYNSSSDIQFNIPLERDFRAASGGHKESAIPMFAWGNDDDEFAFANLTGAVKFSFAGVACQHVKFSFATTTACKINGTFPLSLDTDAAKVKWSAADTEVAAERGVTYYADVESDGTVSFYVPYATGTIWAWNHLTLENADDATADPLYSNTGVKQIDVTKNRITVLPTLNVGPVEPAFESAYNIDWDTIDASTNASTTYTAIQKMKATADENYLYLYLEVDPSKLTTTDLFDHQFHVYISDANGSASYWGSDACSYINKDVWAVSDGNLCFLSWNPTPFEGHIVENSTVCFYEVRVSRTHDLTSALLGDTGSAREIGVGVILDDLYVDSATSQWGRLNNYSPVGVIPTYGTALYPVTLPGAGIVSHYGLSWSGITVAENTGSTYPAIKSLKAQADADYLYLLLGLDPDELDLNHYFSHQFTLYAAGDIGNNGYWSNECFINILGKKAWAYLNEAPTFGDFDSALSDCYAVQQTDIWYYEVKISRSHESVSGVLGAAGTVNIGVTLDDNYCNYENNTEIWKDQSTVVTVGVIPEYGSAMYPVTLPGSEVTQLTYTVPVTQNWVYDNKPTFTVHAENPGETVSGVELKVEITTDKGVSETTVTRTVDVPGGVHDFSLTTPDDLVAGFYQATIKVNGTKVRDTFVFGVSPTQIKSLPDKKSDFDSYWDAALTQLKAVNMNATLTEVTGRSSTARKVYLVEMNSVPDGTSGTPVTIRGYYLEPQDEDVHPVIIHFYGYDSQSPGNLWCPSGGSSAKYAEFYLSTRGQIINNRTWEKRDDNIKRSFTNTYGDWFAYQFGNLDSYYYRGAFMDCVQAVRFMATRPTSDMNNVFAEGSSQGGAFCYAVAALSDEHPLRAIAPGVAFLGDFRDYFSIVSWPGNTAKANKGSMSDDQMYDFLTYFDTKNLVTRIQNCAVIACSSLQDRTCPPHTNLAPYNNLPSGTDKVIYYNPLLGHAVSDDWSSQYKAFFESHKVPNGSN